MSNLKKFWKGILWGAMAGGAMSLLDKDTRLAVKESCQQAARGVTYAIKNRQEITNQIKDKAIRLKETVEEVGEDLSYIASKVEELRETTPQVTSMIKEAKNTFTKNEEEMDDSRKNEYRG